MYQCETDRFLSLKDSKIQASFDRNRDRKRIDVLITTRKPLLMGRPIEITTTWASNSEARQYPSALNKPSHNRSSATLIAAEQITIAALTTALALLITSFRHKQKPANNQAYLYVNVNLCYLCSKPILTQPLEPHERQQNL